MKTIKITDLTPILNSKLPNTGTTIFTEMSALARKHNAVNLSQGFPDFQCANELKQALSNAVNAGHNQYAPMQGILPLREAISEKINRLYQRYYNPDTEITIVPGGTIGIFTAITAFIHPGDEVIIIEPAYDCYIPAVELSRGIPVYSSLQYPDFKLNHDELKGLVNSKTRMIIINTPHNPGTSVLDANDMAFLSELTRDTQIIILSDEVYEHIIFDQAQHQSVALFPELAERSLIVSSFGKTYHVTGWKSGYVTGPAALMSEFRKVYQFNAFCSFAPAQYAFLDMISDPSTYEGVSSFYQQKRDKMASLLSGSIFKVLHSCGSYFQLLDYKNYSDESDYLLAKRLTEAFGIAMIPMSSFYHNKKDQKLLRICFAKEDETLEKAAAILNSIR